ncbi:hypothetical protein [Methylomonas koyamae]|uniref:hypothetical protein n=1 Tax=Methylomonas koyamae TaxID=702114 RepID=UPI0006D25068|nr:hypothetical protein [Methylomonas koyamae]
MAVKIVDESFEEGTHVELDLLITTIEKNRDRVRSVASMLLTFSGTLISFGSAFLLFVSDKAPSERRTISIFAFAILLLITAAALSIFSSFLRNKYSMSNKSEFTSALLQLYSAELRLIGVAACFTILGLTALVTAVASFVATRI